MLLKMIFKVKIKFVRGSGSEPPLPTDHRAYVMATAAQAPGSSSRRAFRKKRDPSTASMSSSKCPDPARGGCERRPPPGVDERRPGMHPVVDERRRLAAGERLLPERLRVALRELEERRAGGGEPRVELLDLGPEAGDLPAGSRRWRSASSRGRTMRERDRAGPGPRRTKSRR
jgi:hypothetical protein